MRVILIAVAALLFVPMCLTGQVRVEPSEGIGNLGISWRVPSDPTTGSKGMSYVSAVFMCSDAHRAGLQIGDRLLVVNGKAGDARGTLFPLAAPGSRYSATLLRAGSDTVDVEWVVDPREPAGVRVTDPEALPPFAEASCPARRAPVKTEADLASPGGPLARSDGA
jgi:hypothetical protein